MAKGHLGYSIRERGSGKAHRFVVAFAHRAEPGKSWPEQTPPKDLRTRTAVAKWAEGIIAEAAVTTPAKPAPKRASGPSVRSLYPAWLAQVSKRPDLQPATTEGYRSAFAANLLELDLADEGGPVRTLGDETIGSLDVAGCRHVIRKLRDAPANRRAHAKLSASRVNNCASALSVFLSDMIADGKAPFPTNPMVDPAVRRELPPRPVSRRVTVGERPGCATLEDAQAVIDSPTTSEEFRVRVTLAFTGAERDGELAGLRVSSIHRAPVPHLTITEAVKIVGPKGPATPGDLKTASAERIVPLHPAALAALDEWLSIHWERLTGRQPMPDDFVFVRPGTVEPHRPRSARLFRRALKDAGRPTVRGGAPITFHRARHTFASALAAAGVPLELRGLLLGHAAASVTEAAYTEHGLERLAAAVASAISITWPRQSTRQSTRQVAESSADSLVISGGEDGIRTRVVRFCKPGSARQEQEGALAANDDYSGRPTQRQRSDVEERSEADSAKPGCRVAEGLRRAVAAGLMVGLADAAWQALGLTDEDVILRAVIGGPALENEPPPAGAGRLAA